MDDYNYKNFIEDEKDVDELAHKLKLDYMRKWRAKNRDKTKRYKDNYWKRQAEKVLKEGESND